MPIYSRTDLASEAQGFRLSSARPLPEGMNCAVRREEVEGLPVTAVDVDGEDSAKALGLPRGHYVTLHLSEAVSRRAPGCFSQGRALSLLIRRFLPQDCTNGVLIAALGNPDITPDALGPLTAESVLVTRHLQNHSLFRRLCVEPVFSVRQEWRARFRSIRSVMPFSHPVFLSWMRWPAPSRRVSAAVFR